MSRTAGGSSSSISGNRPTAGSRKKLSPASSFALATSPMMHSSDEGQNVCQTPASRVTREPAARTRSAPEWTSSGLPSTCAVKDALSAPGEGLAGQSLSVSSPARQMMSSFLRACAWVGVAWPRRAYMSFSLYCGSSARLTSARPWRAKSPRPKSVMSHLGLGGSAQRCASKQAIASRWAWLISERFMGSSERHDRLVALALERRGPDLVLRHRLVRGGAPETPAEQSGALREERGPHLHEDVGKAGFEDPSGDRPERHVEPEVRLL